MIREALLVTALATAGASAQIVSLGNLTDGSTQVGTLPSNTVNNDASTWGFWTFQANAGDMINIEVDRITAALDPVSATWFGDASGQPFNTFGSIFDPGAGFPFVASGDDDDPPAVPGGPWGDPNYGFVATQSGTYTVAVAGFLSAAAPEYRYDITVTGSTVPAPAGLALVGLGGLVAARRRR